MREAISGRNQCEKRVMMSEGDREGGIPEDRAEIKERFSRGNPGRGAPDSRVECKGPGVSLRRAR